MLRFLAGSMQARTSMRSSTGPRQLGRMKRIRGARAPRGRGSRFWSGFLSQDLQPPIVHRRRLLMRPGAVGLGAAGVALHHLDIGMSQQRLQRKQVAFVAQIGNGEGVAEAMRMHALDAGPLADPGQQPRQDVARQRPRSSSGPTTNTGSSGRLSLSRGVRYFHNALAARFPKNTTRSFCPLPSTLMLFAVMLTSPNLIPQSSDAQAGVEQRQDDRVVPIRGRAGVRRQSASSRCATGRTP